MRRVVAAACVDVSAVLLFVAIGRASHHHAETAGGFFSTAWPFAVGVAVGWIVSSRWPLWRLRSGIVVCLATVATGMALRLLVGQGSAWAFVAVAVTFLGAVMVAGRAVVLQAVRPAGRSEPA